MNTSVGRDLWAGQTLEKTFKELGPQCWQICKLAGELLVVVVVVRVGVRSIDWPQS